MLLAVDCPECGRIVKVEAASIAVLSRPAGYAPALHAFVCPACHAPPLAEATGITLLLLRSSGASTHGPREPAIEARSDLPPLTYDDLIDFHVLLTDDRLERFLSTPSAISRTTSPDNGAPMASPPGPNPGPQGAR
jgi:hypothetical protein